MAANNFSTLVTSVQANLDTVLREQIGFIPAVWMNAEASQAAVGQTIQYPIVPEMTAEDATADCCDFPCADGDAWGVGSMVIDHNRRVNFCWTGEEDKAINNSYNYNAENMRNQIIQQAIRTLVNEIEVSIAQTAFNAAQVYTPVNGGVLFNQQSDNLKDFTLIRKALIDANTPDNDLQMVLNTLSGANIRNLYNLTRANEANDDGMLRRGRILEVMNFDIHESKFASTGTAGGNTAGTGTGYLVNGAATAGARTVTLDTGTGTILAGNRVTFAGNTGTYTVVSYAGNVLTLAQPLTGNVADNAAMTIGASYGAQLAFNRRAIVLAARAPAIQGGRDRATNRAYITDPYSGMTFMLSEYPGYRANSWELSIVWGVKMVKPEMAVLIPG